jgi:hypothetical protein
MAGSQAFATVGVQCTILKSSAAPESADDAIGWTFRNGFIPQEINYSSRGFRKIPGSLISGYWESEKRLWLDITTTDSNTINGNKTERIVLKAVANTDRNFPNAIYKGKAFFEVVGKTFDVVCEDR